MRSYGDPCGIARALDQIGERWALLVVRELLLGAKRFTDLVAGLPGASPNVLSQRLRELEDVGVVRRRKLEPPAAAWVYELTPRGRELEPVLLALGRWGSPLPSPPHSELGVDAAMIALKVAFDPSVFGRSRASYQLALEPHRFRIEVAKGRFDLTRGTAPVADAWIDTDVATVRSVVFRGHSLAAAERSRRLRIQGDRDAVVRLFDSFVPGKGVGPAKRLSASPES